MAQAQRLLESLDALIRSGRSGVPLHPTLRHTICDDAASIRDGYARLVARYNQKHGQENSRKRSSREIAEAMWEDIRR
jgi:hypothetical protein